MRIAICDDDQTFISILIGKLKQIFSVLCIEIEIYQFTDSLQFENTLTSGARLFDLYFLDIEMPNRRGTTLAREIRKHDPAAKIAFITSYDDEIFSAFQYKVDAFIPKLLLGERLEPEVVRLVNDIQKDYAADMVAFDVELPPESRHADLDMLLRLQLCDILYFESNNRKVLLHTLDAVYTVKRVSYQETRANYEKRGFVEVHRCYLVNVSRLKGVGKHDVLLDNGETLPLSRRQHNTVVVQYMSHMRR